MLATSIGLPRHIHILLSSCQVLVEGNIIIKFVKEALSNYKLHNKSLKLINSTKFTRYNFNFVF